MYRKYVNDTLVSLSTDKTRLYNVAIKYYHTIVYSTGKHCIVEINKYKGKFCLIIYFKSVVVFIVSSTAGSSCCSVLCFFIFFLPNNLIIHCFAIHSHFIFAINEHKGKWEMFLMNKKTLFVYHVEYRWFNRVLHFIAI